MESKQRAVKGSMTVKELIDGVRSGKITLPTRPKQPWHDKELSERFMKSLTCGHRQVWFKCQQCGLEFIVTTLRGALELIEAYEPHLGKDGGLPGG